MKGLGNYRFRPQTERKVGQVLKYREKSVIVRFRGEPTYGMPIESFKNLGIKEGERFVLLVSRVGDEVVGVKVEVAPKARPYLKIGHRTKVLVRSGRRVVTRKKP